LIRSLVRALTAPAAIAAAFALAGCYADNVVPTGRAQAPLSAQTVALIESKNMDKGSPILVRVFKEEAILEVWKKNREGNYALLKSYPICKWSGDLGPKKKQGDRQAPEGFYTITPGQMNPNSNYYLAFNTGYPNAYDRAWGRTGSELMVHGDCSSRGCYAMTDKQIVEIYALARESFFGGQREFQFEAFPFRMTALNMAKHRNNPNFAFWKMLKEGYDHFEATHQEPKVAVCEKRYVFDAAPREGEGQLHFSSRGKCPAYRLDPAIASLILEHRRSEQVKMANYIARGVQTAAPHVGDGGTNVAFSSSGAFQVASAGEVPGALPRVPNPPGTTIPKVGKPSTTAAKKPEPASQPPAQQPSAQPIVVASVPVPEPAPQPKEGRVPAERPTTIASLIGNLFKGGSRADTNAPRQTLSETATTVASADLSRTNTEPAANPMRPADNRSAETRVASAPMTLSAKPQRGAQPPKPVVAERQPQPAPIAPIRTAQREPAPAAIAPARTAQPAPAPIAPIRTTNHAPPPVAPVRTAQREPAPTPIAPVRTAHRNPEPTPVRTAHREPRPAPAAPVHTAQRPAATEKPRVKRVAKAEPPAREPILRTAFSAPPASSNGLLSGAAPVVAAGSFSTH
jgi:murein L,D-transpeptidase YafK